MAGTREVFVGGLKTVTFVFDINRLIISMLAFVYFCHN